MHFDIIRSGHSAYAPGLRRGLLRAANTGRISLAGLCDMHWSIGRHLAGIGKRVGRDADAGIFSGHTMYHTEQIGKTGKGTYQIGAVEPLSLALDIPVMGDLRSTDVAAGGMGAPLVPRADEIMFGRGAAVLNLGGIANVTLLGERTTGFDTGPGNMLIDEATRTLFGQEMDRGGRIARSGRPDEKMLEVLLRDAYVRARPPKSCGRERYGSAYFNRVHRLAKKVGMSNMDVVATVTEFTARSITLNMKRFAPGYRQLICAGGGSKNSYLTARLRDLFGGSVHMSEEFGVPRDSRESIAFALLCYLSLKLLPSNSDATGARMKIPLGRVTAFGFERDLSQSISL